jgi:hypothetical protein
MKDWLKGLVFVIMGNVLYEVIPVWVSNYLLSQPNPLYQWGEFLKRLPSLQDIISGNMGASGGTVIGIIGIALIAYGLYLFVKDLYNRS